MADGIVLPVIEIEDVVVRRSAEAGPVEEIERLKINTFEGVRRVIARVVAKDGTDSGIDEMRPLCNHVRVLLHARIQLAGIGPAEVEPAAAVKIRPQAPHRPAVELAVIP